MAQIKKTEFLQAVEAEVHAIKLHATTEEIGRLLSKFNGEKQTKCVYGQLTGSCESPRAKELMELSCQRVVATTLKSQRHLKFVGSFFTKARSRKTFTALKDFVRPVGTGLKMWDEDEERRNYDYLSALETYILTDKSNHTAIINYLRGTSDSLNL
tara:strand:- start:1845 stop:2312 length:468 start_codon:yes stop_codon:yes gene_type:complete